MTLVLLAMLPQMITMMAILMALTPMTMLLLLSLLLLREWLSAFLSGSSQVRLLDYTGSESLCDDHAYDDDDDDDWSDPKASLHSDLHKQRMSDEVAAYPANARRRYLQISHCRH